jgi:hypothetical protein
MRRAWQNGRLWWNDHDAIVLTGDLSDDSLGRHVGSVTVKDVPPHGARLLVVESTP